MIICHAVIEACCIGSEVLSNIGWDGVSWSGEGSCEIILKGAQTLTSFFLSRLDGGKMRRFLHHTRIILPSKIQDATSLWVKRGRRGRAAGRKYRG